MRAVGKGVCALKRVYDDTGKPVLSIGSQIEEKFLRCL